MTSSERRRETALGTVRREEVERQTEAKLSLKKLKIQLQSMKSQLEFNVVLDESHQKLAKATIIWKTPISWRTLLKSMPFVVEGWNWQWPFRTSKRSKTGQELGDRLIASSGNSWTGCGSKVSACKIASEFLLSSLEKAARNLELKNFQKEKCNAARWNYKQKETTGL